MMSATPKWLRFSQQTPVVSVIHDGTLYTSGRSFSLQYPPGALDKLFQTLGHEPPVIISVNENEQAEYADLVVRDMQRLGWTWLNARTAGKSLALWFGPGRLPTFDQIVGATNRGGTEPKDQAKRNGVMSPLNSPWQGAFVSRGPSRLTPVTLADDTEAQYLTITLPDGQTLRALAIPDNPQATDGDMLISGEAVLAIAKAAGMKFAPEDLMRTDSVQDLVLGQDAGIKAMGQHGGRIPWPERFRGFDIVVGEPGLLMKTQRNITCGKITMLMEPPDILGYFVVDGLESSVNCWENFSPVEEMCRLEHLLLVKDILHRQMRALQRDDGRSDWHDEKTARHPEEDRILTQQIWAQETADKQSLGQVARMVCQSPFAHPEAFGSAPGTPLRVVRSAVEKGKAAAMPRIDNLPQRPQANPQKPQGLPYMVVPGFSLKRAYYEFGGVEEPEYGWATIMWRPNGTPYCFVLNSKQYADPNEYHWHNGADGDDHFMCAMGLTWDHTPRMVAVRPPNSPDNGNAYRVTSQDYERWKRITSILPLKPEEQWHRIPDPSNHPAILNLGPELTPPAPTRDLDVKKAVGRFGAKANSEIGPFANLHQTLHTAGVPLEKLVFNGSDMPDNVWLQTHDGQHLINQLLDMAVDWERQGNSWYEPTLVRVASMVADRAMETDAAPLQFRTGSHPSYEMRWESLLTLEDTMDVLHETFMYRVNGNSDKLVTPCPDPAVAFLAAKTVQQVRQLWKADYREQNRIRYTKGLSPRVRNRRLQEAKARTMERIRSAVETNYDEARENDARPGIYAVALMQAAIVFGERWEQPRNPTYRVEAYRQKLPKHPYGLLHYLPRKEQEAYFDDSGFLPTGPTWIARLQAAGNGVKPEPGRYYTVEPHGPRWALIPEEGDQAVAYLPAEGYGLLGTSAELAGFIPRQQFSKRMPDFCVDQDVAVFRQEHQQLLSRAQRHYAAAADRLREYQEQI